MSICCNSGFVRSLQAREDSNHRLTQMNTDGIRMNSKLMILNSVQGERFEVCELLKLVRTQKADNKSFPHLWLSVFICGSVFGAIDAAS